MKDYEKMQNAREREAIIYNGLEQAKLAMQGIAKMRENNEKFIKTMADIQLDCGVDPAKVEEEANRRRGVFALNMQKWEKEIYEQFIAPATNLMPPYRTL